MYQLFGAEDDVFEISHAKRFHAALVSKRIPVQTIILAKKGHAFDIKENIGGEIHERVLKPAVEWVARFAGVEAKQTGPSHWGTGLGELGVVLT